MTDPRPAAAPAEDEALRGAILEELQRGVPSVYWHIDPLLELIHAREADTARQLAEAHEQIVRLKRERDAGAGRHPSGMTWRESVDLLSQVAGETADELGCEHDNEAVLVAIHELRERADSATAERDAAREALDLYEKAIDEAEAIFGSEYGDDYGPMFDLALAARRARAPSSRIG